jgi:PIN domain nuclease of toxin-antitoxin system
MAKLDYLLDTHALLWYAQAPKLLPEEVIQLICQPDAVVYLSRVSLLEVAIKYSIGKLELKGTFERWLQRIGQMGFRKLEISDQHLTTLATLPMQPDHRDPFDRLLIAQALSEDLTLISRDGKFAAYAGLRLQWD